MQRYCLLKLLILLMIVVVHNALTTNYYASQIGNMGTRSEFGDGQIATQCQFKEPSQVTQHGSFLYVTDTKNSRIRSINLNTLIVSTIAGSDRGYYDYVRIHFFRSIIFNC